MLFRPNSFRSMLMSPQDASAVLDQLEPALRAAAKNVLRHAYGPDGLPWGTRLDQTEDLAVLVAHRLGQLILQVGLQQQADRALPDALRVCPGCGLATQDRPHQPRDLQTSLGDITWQQPAAYCPRCRRAFSPSGPEPGA
jgi:hypothetical protein